MVKMTDINKLILDNAKELFAHYGIKKTTMDEVAETSGIAKGTIYNYFKSKEELFAEIIKKESEMFFYKLDNNIKKGTNPEEKLKLFVTGYFSIMYEYKNLFNLIYSKKDTSFELMPLIYKGIQKYKHKIHDFLKNIIDDGINQNIFRQYDSKLLSDIVFNIFLMVGFPLNNKFLNDDIKIILKNINFMMDLILTGLKT